MERKKLRTIASDTGHSLQIYGSAEEMHQFFTTDPLGDIKEEEDDEDDPLKDPIPEIKK